MPLNEKYRPKSFNEVRGQILAVEKAKAFVNNFGRGKKALILHGPPGSGKTTIAHVSAIENNAELFELNASDLRDREKLERILKPALEQKSLLKNKKIILIDEVDGISAVDRGGLTVLLYLIKTAIYPIIITANNIWHKKFSELRKVSDLVVVKEIDYNTIKSILIDILRKENHFIDNDILTSISIKARGDARAAINDLQTIINYPNVKPEELAERNKEIDIFNVLRMIFKNKPSREMLDIFDSLNMPLDEILLWVEENIPYEYKGKDLAKAYEYLSKADVFKGRIYKQQYWRFLVYENILLSYGISSAKSHNIPGFTSYKKPDRILKIWLNNQKQAKKKSICIKYAKYVHIGEKRAMSEFVIIKQILKSNNEIQKELKLNEEEIEYVLR